MKSGAFFPLRSNAHALLAGRPASSVRSRIKIAALLYDEVYLQEGQHTLLAGPGGNMEWPYPIDESDLPTWQSSRDRGASIGRDFSLGMAPSDVSPDHQFHPVMHSSAEVAWRPTLEPIKRELPRAYEWLQFGRVKDPPSSVLQPWIQADMQEGWLKDKLPNHFVRRLVSGNANKDLIVGASLRAVVSLDDMHQSIITMRVRSGQAKPAHGGVTLRVLIPDVSELDWPEIDELRGHKDLRYLRDVYREIEAEAWGSAASLNELEKLIRGSYEESLRQAETRSRGTWRHRALAAGRGFFVGELVGAAASLVTGPTPFVGGLIGSTASFAVDQVQAYHSRPRWLAAERAIRRRAQRSTSLRDQAR